MPVLRFGFLTDVASCSRIHDTTLDLFAEDILTGEEGLGCCGDAAHILAMITVFVGWRALRIHKPAAFVAEDAELCRIDADDQLHRDPAMAVAAHWR